MRSTKRDSISTGATTTTSTTPAKTVASGTPAASTTNKLEVTVIPVDDEPYSKTIVIPSSMIGKYHTFYYIKYLHIFSDVNTVVCCIK